MQSGIFYNHPVKARHKASFGKHYHVSFVAERRSPAFFWEIFPYRLQYMGIFTHAWKNFPRTHFRLYPLISTRPTDFPP